jgi:hypothetical protein
MTPEEKVRYVLGDKASVVYDVFGNEPKTAYVITQTIPYSPIGFGESLEAAWACAWERLKHIRRQDDPVPFGMDWPMAQRVENILREHGE